MAQALFVITDAGINSLFEAEEKGIRCAITKFTLGNAYGYDPVGEDTAMHGDLLYSGEPSRYKYIDQKTKLIVCEVPVEAGPFTFGEIGLWLDDGTLFALCSLGNAIEKYSSNESSVASSITLNCLLTVEQGISHLTIGYEDNPASTGAIEIDTAGSWLNMDSPLNMGKDIFIQEVIVQEPSPDGRQTLLLRDLINDDWQVASTWSFLKEAVPTSSDANSVTFANQAIIDSDYIDSTPNGYLIQVGNAFRLATGNRDGENLKLTFNDPLTIEGSVKVFHPEYRMMECLGIGLNNLWNNIGNHYVTLETEQTITADKTFTGNVSFTNTILGVAQYALWADLAECYESDYEYPEGTLIKFGGKKEVTVADDKVNGVVSSRPGFLLNHAQENAVPVALAGRVPIRVKGRVERFDNIVLSEEAGVGMVNNSASDEEVIGKALRSKHTREEGLVLCATRFTLK